MIVVLYVIAALIGISLGLIGAGGAIVAVPAFVYLAGISPTLASGYALFVVTVASAVGSAQYVQKKLVDWRSVLAFGSTTLLSIAIVRRFILPSIPASFVAWPSTFVLQRDTTLMVAFAAVLMAASVGMLRKRETRVPAGPTHVGRLAFFGLVIGVVSGFLGVGGGFLMTPALVLWAGLDMRRAVGTSLVLITANSAVGVVSDLSRGAIYDWPFVLVFTAITTAGIVAGTYLSHRIDSTKLKAGFGWFVLAIGIAVMLRELLY
ncbi:MAG: sulfite exporter TauE/SafE family protein [Candidatus Kapabacteria bacterium]|nr:sulfite exporter TauE/SafE family protein [Candidatus Kapabacteria bacterium]